MVNYGADAIIDAKTAFDPSVEGKEDGVIWKEIDAFGKIGTNESRSEEGNGCHVMVQ